MTLTRRPPGSPSEGGLEHSGSHRAVADRLSVWTARSKRTAVAFVLVGSAFFAGPVPVATAGGTGSYSGNGTVAAPEANDSSDAERTLGERLAVEYAGAVPAADVESLVRRVSRQLRREASPPERLLGTSEAICRRALTDYLARRVQLPFD